MELLTQAMERKTGGVTPNFTAFVPNTELWKHNTPNV